MPRTVGHTLTYIQRIFCPKQLVWKIVLCGTPFTAPLGAHISLLLHEQVGSQADAIAESLCCVLRAATASVCTSLGVQGFDPSGVRVLKQGPLGGGKKGQQASTEKSQSPSAEEIGGYSSALALQLSAHLRKQGGKALSPVDVAQLLVSTCTLPADVRVCVASNGFLNFHLPPAKAQEAEVEEEEGEGMVVDKEEGKRLRGSVVAPKTAAGPSAFAGASAMAGPSAIMVEEQRKGGEGQGERKEVAKAWAERRRKKTGEGHLRRVGSNFEKYRINYTYIYIYIYSL